MPEYLAPGVYVEEISTGPKPIEGVSTSNAGFLGATERGPEYVRLITSWLEFQRWYGSYLPGSFLPYSVQGFFDNGGKRCFIGRVTPDNATFASSLLEGLVVFALGKGSWGNNIRIKVAEATKRPDWVRIQILYYRDFPDPFVDPTDPEQITNPNRVDPDVLEDYDNLTHENATNRIDKVINAASRLVRCWWPDGTPPTPVPVTNEFAQLATAANATDDPVQAADFTGEPGSILDAAPDEQLGRDTGFEGLSRVDEVSLLVVPDEVRFGTNVSANAINQCEELKDRFALVSVQQGQSTVGQLNPIQDTKYAAFYYPWIRVYDPQADEYPLIPPTGHIAGIVARTDIERGVHKAPANEVVRGAVNMEFAVTKGMQDVLNPRGVNCIRDFRPDGRGIRLWGARTMSSDPEWRYVNVRRLFLFVEESIDEGTQWVVFEPNHEPTWSRVRRSITNFLIRVWKSGALMGTTQDEAFFVKCDRSTMEQADIDAGMLICYIGIAPVKPAEFVIFRISQKTVESQG